MRCIDIKLRRTAQALKSWSAKHIGSVRLQLAIAKEIVYRFDLAQEHRLLSAAERELRRKAKLCSLGLASLQRTILRQRARITFLAEGDANTKFFHLQACHRSRKNFINKLKVGENFLAQNEQMADGVYNHFMGIMGSPGQQLCSIDLTQLGLPSMHSSLLDACITEEEVWHAIQDMPVDKAPGTDGFTGLFYKSAWQIIKADIMRAFHAIWSLDGRSLYLLN